MVTEMTPRERQKPFHFLNTSDGKQILIYCLPLIPQLVELDEDEETLPGVTAVDVAAEAEAPEPDRAEGKVPTPEWVASVNLENREVPPLSHRD